MSSHSPHDAADTIFDMLRRGMGDNVITGVRAGRIDPNLCNSDGVPLLNMAVMQNNHVLVESLLTAHANLESRDAGGSTPLAIACFRGLPDIMDTLLKNGADPDTEDNSGTRPVHLLAGSNHRGSFMMLRQLLIAGADPNLTDHNGDAALHLAIQGEDWFKTKLLIQAGADTGAVSSTKTRAFHMIELSPKLRDLSDLAGDAYSWYRQETMLDKSLVEWRNKRVKNPEFPFEGLVP